MQLINDCPSITAVLFCDYGAILRCGMTDFSFTKIKAQIIPFLNFFIF